MVDVTRVLLSSVFTVAGGFADVKRGRVTATYRVAPGRDRVAVVGDEVRFSKPIVFEIVDGQPVDVVEMVPTRGECYVEWLIEDEDTRFRRFLSRNTEIPDVDVIGFGDLIDVDPTTYLPSDEGQAAWDAAVAAAAGFLADGQAAAVSSATSAEAASEAASAADEAAQTALTVAGEVGPARDEAVQAAQDATEALTGAVSAEAAAQAAAASVNPGVAGGTATLDGGARLPEAQVPERLSAAGIADTIGAAVAPVSAELNAVKRQGSDLIRAMVGAAVMSTPPTITASASAPSAFSRSLRFAPGNTNYWAGFRISGAPLVSDGATATARSKGATKNTPGTNSWGGCQRVEFDLHSDGFVFTAQVPASFSFKIWVDGRPHMAQMQQGGTVSGVSGTGTHHFTVDFGSVAHRRITLEWASLPVSPSLTQGLRFKPTATVLPPSIPSPRFMVIGDSYRYGIGATDVADAEAIVLGRLLGYADIWNSTSVPSTGVLKADTANDFGRYSTRFATDVIPYLAAGDVLVYSGSANDGGQTAGAVQAQATADLQALRAALPGVTILVTSPVYMTTPLASHLVVRSEMAAAAAAAGLPFIDMMDTTLGLWFGTGTTAAPTSDGNADVNAVDVGGIHPSSAGARSLAFRERSLMAPVLGQAA